MIYLLDTDALVFLLRGRKRNAPPARRRQSESLWARCREALRQGHRVGVSAISIAELEFGGRLSVNYAVEMRAVRKVLNAFERLDFDAVRAPKHYGTIRLDLQRSGKPIGSMDLLIAAHARSLAAELVTNNRDHFSRVTGLMLADWIPQAS